MLWERALSLSWMPHESIASDTNRKVFKHGLKSHFSQQCGLESHWLWGSVSGVLKWNPCSSAFFLQENILNQSLNTQYPSHAGFNVFDHRPGQVLLCSHSFSWMSPLKMWHWVKLHALGVKILPTCWKWEGSWGVLLVCLCVASLF